MKQGSLHAAAQVQRRKIKVQLEQKQKLTSAQKRAAEQARRKAELERKRAAAETRRAALKDQKRRAAMLRSAQPRQVTLKAKLASGERRRSTHPVTHALNLTGALGAVFFALTFNFAVHPQALASEPNVLLVMHILRAGPMAPATTPVMAEVPPIAVQPPDPETVHLLAATAWAEARGEGEEGMRAVAHVVVNRIGSRFGEDVHDVVLSPKQFSSWNLHDPNRPLALHPERYAQSGQNAATWEQAQEVARQVLTGQSRDPTGGALFYHASSIRPWWSRFGVGQHQIGGHVFYSDVPDHPSHG